MKAEQLRELVEVALSSPEERGLPFSNWSVPKLAEYCRSKHLLPPVTDEWVRRLLRTWKRSHNPQFDRYPSHAVRRRRVYRYLRYRHRKVGTTRHPLAGIRRLRFMKLDRH